MLGNGEDITFWPSDEILKESEGSQAVFDSIHSLDLVEGLDDVLNRVELKSLQNLVVVAYTSKIQSRTKAVLMFELASNKFKEGYRIETPQI